MDTIPARLWSLPVSDVLTATSSAKNGLSASEAAARLARYGENVLTSERHTTIFERFVTKLVNPLIVLLLVAAGISAATRQTSDFFIILVITVVSICLDVYQESAADLAADKLKKRVSLTATVLRSGTAEDIPLKHVVVGDVIRVGIGDIIPADARLISSRDLLVDQSTLTGESYPQEKFSDARVEASAEVGERTNMLFMGTNVISGEGFAVIIGTGARTELGKISGHLVAPRPQTDFERGINAFGLLLMRTAIVVSLFVFGMHIILGHDLLSSMLFVLALAIGFAPELLPMVITINLSRGALRMAGRGVIVKRLASIENFGSMDILATDKTGTLTENKIVLERYEDPSGAKSEKVLQYGYLSSVFQSGFRGPMEDAILAHKEAHLHGFARIGVIPFDFYRKRVSVAVVKGTTRLLITKGAPEEIFKLSKLTPAARTKLMDRVAAYGNDGLRVLGVGYKTIPANKKDFSAEDEQGLTFLGYMAFLDPAKKTALSSVKRLTDHNIIVKILTGDNEVVTQKICRDIGLTVMGVLRGEEIENMSDVHLAHRVETTTIFARLNPDLKVRVIAALRKNGHVVGYMGDGINDAPSIRAADVGISVNNATDVAKLSADIILLHKDLHVLMDGVHEGRVTFANVMKYLKMNISSDFGNMVSVAIASVFLPFLPILPVQVLLNDLLYDMSQLTLASDGVEERYLTRPRRWDVRGIRRFMVVFGPASSVFDLVTFGILLYVFHANPMFFQTGWFLESIITQTLIIFSIRTPASPFYRSRPSKLFALSLFAVVAVALALPYSPVAVYFTFVKMPAVYYVLLGGLLASYFMLVEGLKLWFYRTADV